MAHRMGLVVLDMTTGKSVFETKTMTYDTNARTTDETCLISNSTSTTTIYPCHEFNTSSGYTGTLLNASTSGKDCYYIVKCSPTVASSNIKVGCVSTERKEYWDDVNVGAGLHSGECVSRQINSNRTFANLVALFSCVGKCQEITLPWYGSYKMECWGAKGADSETGIGGKGGYTTGTITLHKNKELFVFVGAGVAKETIPGGWNGGGKGYIGPTQFGYGGGGATDIRVYVNSAKDWNDNQSIISRIMVAGAGGGAGDYYAGGDNPGLGGCGGGLEGEDGHEDVGTWIGTGFSGLKGTQIAGGQLGDGTYPTNPTPYPSHALINQYHLNDGGLGYGGWNAASVANNGSGAQTNYGAPGGGSGYYGGGGANRGHGGGGGGSSFISGMTGCIALEGYRGDNNTILKYDNEQYIFEGASTIGGSSASLPSNPGYVSSTVTNGYAKITSQ